MRGSAAQLVVSTSIGALDDVFGCLDQSEAQILVNPSRAERVIALGRMLARTGNRVRELGRKTASPAAPDRAGDQHRRPARTTLVAGNADAETASAFRFRAREAGPARLDEGTDRLVRTARPPLPDPRLVRKIIRQRQLRARYFEGDLFADPAWDMLLDLTAARVERARLGHLAVHRLGRAAHHRAALDRPDDRRRPAPARGRRTDRRRAFITLTDKVPTPWPAISPSWARAVARSSDRMKKGMTRGQGPFTPLSLAVVAPLAMPGMGSRHCPVQSSWGAGACPLRYSLFLSARAVSAA
jgi:hypothetical protein